MLFQCWFSVADGGPTLKQHLINVAAASSLYDADNGREVVEGGSDLYIDTLLCVYKNVIFIFHALSSLLTPIKHAGDQ